MRAGHRLALVYNLILQGSSGGQLPSAAAATGPPVMPAAALPAPAAGAGGDAKVQRVAALLRTWLEEEPVPLCFLLEHK